MSFRATLPHSPRHSAITFALDAGACLRDVLGGADRKEPRTTRRYDNSATAWTAAYTIGPYLA
jgi:hypothetical protein